MRRCFLILLLSIIISPFIYSGGTNESTTHQLMVYVSIPPQAYLVERIGGIRLIDRVTSIGLLGSAKELAELIGSPPHEAEMRLGEIVDNDSMLRIGTRMFAITATDIHGGYWNRVRGADAIRLAFALADYEQAHGAFPEALGALVPDFIEAIPIDPLIGEPLEYERNGAGYVLKDTRFYKELLRVE